MNITKLNRLKVILLFIIIFGFYTFGCYQNKNNLKIILSNGGECTIYDATPLMRAVAQEDLNEIEKLIRDGEDINAERKYRTIIFSGSKSGIETKGKVRAINIAIEKGRKGLIGFLLSNGSKWHFNRGLQ
jgi:hypothetical protein